jgi:hypothetical protein
MFASSNGSTSKRSNGGQQWHHEGPRAPLLSSPCRGLASLSAKHCLPGAHTASGDAVARGMHCSVTTCTVPSLSSPNKDAIFGLRRRIACDHFFYFHLDVLCLRCVFTLCSSTRYRHKPDCHLSTRYRHKPDCHVLIDSPDENILV